MEKGSVRPNDYASLLEEFVVKQQTEVTASGISYHTTKNPNNFFNWFLSTAQFKQIFAQTVDPSLRQDRYYTGEENPLGLFRGDLHESLAIISHAQKVANESKKFLLLPGEKFRHFIVGLDLLVLEKDPTALNALSVIKHAREDTKSRYNPDGVIVDTIVLNSLLANKGRRDIPSSPIIASCEATYATRWQYFDHKKRVFQKAKKQFPTLLADSFCQAIVPDKSPLQHVARGIKIATTEYTRAQFDEITAQIIYYFTPDGFRQPLIKERPDIAKELSRFEKFQSSQSGSQMKRRLLASN